MFYILVLCERLLVKQVSCYSSTCTFNTWFTPTADTTCLISHNTQADYKHVKTSKQRNCLLKFVVVQNLLISVASLSVINNYFSVTSLENQRLFLSLSTFCKIIHNHIYFPSSMSSSQRCNHVQQYSIPLVHTNRFNRSRLPSTYYSFMEYFTF